MAARLGLAPRLDTTSFAPAPPYGVHAHTLARKWSVRGHCDLHGGRKRRVREAQGSQWPLPRRHATTNPGQDILAIRGD